MFVRVCIPPAEKFQRGRAIDRGEVDIGAQVTQVIPPSLFWRFHLTIHHPTYVKFNLSLSREALLGVYGRRNLPPTHTQVRCTPPTPKFKVLPLARAGTLRPSSASN